MSLSLSLQTALSGLRLNQTALDVTANNIANVNTEGYSRKILESEAMVLDDRGAGAKVGSITRQIDEFLLREVRTESSSLGMVQVEDFYFGRMQDLFGAPGDNRSISETITTLATRLQSLAATPENFTERSQVINAATELARQYNNMETDIQGLRADADQQIADSVDRINGALTNIGELNIQVSNALGAGRTASDLLDHRDIQLKKLSELIDVTTFKRSSGEVVVLSGGGRVLVDRNVSQLSHTTVSFFDASVSYAGGGLGPINMNGIDITTEIKSGKLAGFIAMRDTELPNLAAQLDTLARSMRDQINADHNQGVGVPPPRTLTGTVTQATGATTVFAGTGTARIAVLGADRTFATAPLDFDLTTAATAGAVVTAINTALAGFATASINANNKLVITADNAANSIAIDEGTSQAGGRGFSHYFGLNDFFVDTGTASVAASIAVRADLVSAPATLATSRLNDIAAGSITVGTTSGVAAGDNRSVQAMANKFDAIVSFGASGGLPANSTTFSSYGGQILSRNAGAAADTSSRLSFRQTLLENLEAKSGAVSGVNIDEELANLVMFQNAYGASARLISVASEMLELLTNIGR